MYIVIISFPVYDIVNFEIIKPSSYLTKKFMIKV